MNPIIPKISAINENEELRFLRDMYITIMIGSVHMTAIKYKISRLRNPTKIFSCNNFKISFGNNGINIKDIIDKIMKRIVRIEKEAPNLKMVFK
jgi:hypothetical protein